MSITTSDQMLSPLSTWDAPWDLAKRMPRGAMVAIVAALILVTGHQVSLALQSPAQSIKNALTAASVALTTRLVARPSADDLEAIQQFFAGQNATIDARAWPQVAVTVRGVDRTTCIEVATVAGRIEGLAVAQLANYRSVADCGDGNDMTWRILP